MKKNESEQIRFVDVFDNVLAPLTLLILGCVLVYLLMLIGE